MRSIVVASCALVMSSCSQPPALITDARKAELLRSLKGELDRSVETEKSAVLATTDEESARFAQESRQASEQVDRLRQELRPILIGEERTRLDTFEAAWAKVVAIDAKLLPLATANTNLKAARLAANEAAALLDVVLGALASAEAVTKDPVRLRELSAASVAALRIQVIHPPHIASAEDAQMTALEARAHEFELKVDQVLAKPAGVETQALSAASQPWADYKRATETIFTLSRQNTNVFSYAISVHEKRDASLACDAALQALITHVHRGPTPTR
jgi:hypothetical protein